MTNTKGSSPVTSNVEFSREAMATVKSLWSAWVKGKLYEPLGIREKTAIGVCRKHEPFKHERNCSGTRAVMLAVANYGYAQGQALGLARALRHHLGLNPVGGIDFAWLEQASNIASITSTATVRLDSRDGKMRLQAKGKAKSIASSASKPSAPKVKGNNDSRSSEVRIVRESDAARAAAMADIESSLSDASNG